MREVFTFALVFFFLSGLLAIAAGFSGVSEPLLLNFWAGVIILLPCMIAAILLRNVPWTERDEPPTERKDPNQPSQ